MATKEKTFTTFTAEQAQQYATGRGWSYPPQLYQAILDYHEGKHDLLLDVGTGPGKVVFDMLPSFSHGIGCDPSNGMIEQAKKDAAKRGFEDKTSFVQCGGESCDEAITETGKRQADIITVAMAAHWMDMDKFYNAAAKALRGGGTLAIWTCSSMYCHPSTPNAAAVQEAMHDLENNILKPYHTPGNMLAKTGYETLVMPWNGSNTWSSFEEASFKRVEWDKGGQPSAPNNADGTAGSFLTHREVTLTELGYGLGTASSVIRYREEHPDKAHTDKDPVVMTMNRIRARLGGKESFVASPSTHLLLMRKL